jgi:hypothetical protein
MILSKKSLESQRQNNFRIFKEHRAMSGGHHLRKATNTPQPVHSWIRRVQASRGARRWWSQSESNRRPPACKAGALPVELWPLTSRGRDWWVWEDLNLRPHPYQGCALTN